MREIVLDTETTGLDPAAGHRVVEIGCVELISHVPTGNYRQWYMNPERDMPVEAEAVHGLSASFLAEQPLFSAIAEAFLAFLGDATLIIHNAAFDMKFINYELHVCGINSPLSNRVIDTIAMARQKLPGAQVNLDALCRRFSIDNSSRTVHGALLDSQLLAKVYLELIGGREPGLALVMPIAAAAISAVTRLYHPARPHMASSSELSAYNALISKLKDPLWRL